uniref:Uncharacterized protein n=1 Tax=Anguilla anguilla TaxID=7936 RepID=A0A0E9PQN8_ANGAN
MEELYKCYLTVLTSSSGNQLKRS